MTDRMTTARAVIDALEDLAPETPLGFASSTGEIGGGYHITELKHARIRSIDCGGRMDSWDEAQLQLLDGTGGDWMTAGKVTQILGRCVAALPDLAEVPLFVEFGPGNGALTRFTAEALEHGNGRAVVALKTETALCKPAAAFAAIPAAAAQCCGSAPTTRCCG